MKIYTRTGDAGSTGLFGGERVGKDDPRVGAYGAVDEANAFIGLAAAHALPPEIARELNAIMSDLFDIGAELATPPSKSATLGAKLDTAIDAARIAELERFIDAVDAEVPPLTTFVLPTGSEGAARLHVARVVVRRAEREIVHAASGGIDVRPEVLAYVNRLSDLLFAWARLCNHRDGRGDTAWKAKKDRA